MTQPDQARVAAEQAVTDAQSALDTLLAGGNASQDDITAAEQALADAQAALEQLDDGDGDKPLGPPGEKAYEAEKTKRREEAARRREAEARLAAAEAELARVKAGGGDAEAAAAAEKDQIRKDALAVANKRIVRAEVQRLATGKLANPALALRLLEVDGFEVDDDGNVDEDEINEAIDGLLEKEPYLRAQGRRFQGGDPDGGRRTPPAPGKPVQVTDAELKKMSPEEIVKAQAEGRLEDLLTGG